MGTGPGLNISEELGVLLLGFSIYDSVHAKWKLAAHMPEFDAGEFGWARAALIVIFCSVIGVSLAISYRTNSRVFRNDGQSVTQKSAELVKNSKLLVTVATLLAASAIIGAFFCLGLRQAFLVWLGFWFVNGAPLMDWWTSKI